MTKLAYKTLKTPEAKKSRQADLRKKWRAITAKRDLSWESVKIEIRVYGQVYGKLLQQFQQQHRRAIAVQQLEEDIVDKRFQIYQLQCTMDYASLQMADLEYKNKCEDTNKEAEKTDAKRTEEAEKTRRDAEKTRLQESKNTKDRRDKVFEERAAHQTKMTGWQAAALAKEEAKEAKLDAAAKASSPSPNVVPPPPVAPAPNMVPPPAAAATPSPAGSIGSSTSSTDEMWSNEKKETFTYSENDKFSSGSFDLKTPGTRKKRGPTGIARATTSKANLASAQKRNGEAKKASLLALERSRYKDNSLLQYTHKGEEITVLVVKGYPAPNREYNLYKIADGSGNVLDKPVKHSELNPLK